MAISRESTSFYQDGGSLPLGSPSYVPRQADEDLYQHLKVGQFCYVLTPRQMGKSSLRIRTTERLRADGVRCANIDLTSIGSKNVTHEQWYYGLLSRIAQDLGLGRNELALWWREKVDHSPLQRFALYIDEVVLRHPLLTIIMIDEVDFLLGLDAQEFSSDDFFAVIRSFYNQRAEDPRYCTLSFCLFGVAAPNDLMRNPERTPFNIGRAIELGPLLSTESQKLLEGIQGARLEPSVVLDRVLHWTGGQPYLTQRLLKLIEERGEEISRIEDIDALVEQQFISASKSDSNLVNISNRILLNEAYASSMLEIIMQLLANESMETNGADLAQVNLLLSGLIVDSGGRLTYSNRIYLAVFDNQWLARALDRVKRPFSEDLKRWLELDKSPAAALRGEVLEKALAWAEGRTDLSPSEHEFLRVCQQVREEEARRALQAEHAIKIKRKNRLLAGLATICALAALLALFFAFRAASAEQRRLQIYNSLNQSMEDLAKKPECLEQIITYVNRNPEILRKDIKANISVLRNREIPLETPMEVPKDAHNSSSIAAKPGTPTKVEGARQALSEASRREAVATAEAAGIVVPSEDLDKYPALTNMILRSDSMNTEERNYWLQVLPVMTPDQIAELDDILDTERRKLVAIDAKYQGAASILNEIQERLDKRPGTLSALDVFRKLGSLAEGESLDSHGIEKAERLALSTKRLFTDPSDYYYFVADLYRKMRKYPLASQASLKALELNSRHFGAHKMAAKMFVINRNREAALYHYEKALALAETFADLFSVNQAENARGVLMIEAAVAYADPAHKRKALDLLWSGLKLLRKTKTASGEWEKQYADGLLSGAEINYRSRDYGEAVRYGTERVLLLNTCKCVDSTARARAYGTLAWYQLFARNYTDSIGSSKLGLSLSENEKWIELNLAHGLLLAGQYEEAKAIYLKYRGKVGEDGRKWDVINRDDFRLLREAGISSPNMNRIEKLFTSTSPS